VLPIPVGATAVLDVVVTEAHTVDFDEMGRVHPVYATYTMARHFEEAGRKLLVPHLEPGEAGIGTSVSVEHLAPSWVGDELRVTARCVEVRSGRLTCECRATDSYGRDLGHGTTVQAVLPAEVVEARVSEEARLSRRRTSEPTGTRPPATADVQPASGRAGSAENIVTRSSPPQEARSSPEAAHSGERNPAFMASADSNTSSASRK
jgi:fluoroacetyl-CoA thioesterase